MKIPLSWLREFTPVPSEITVDELEQAFVRVGFEVESIEITGADVHGPLVVGRVLSIEQVEGQKKPIRYVGLDCGEGESRFVICGASNFKVNDLVVVALPGSILPGDFPISARQTYGHLSNGMICSARELRISDDHTGIIVLPEGAASVGSDAKELLEIDDVTIDLSILADRGYALSARGLARELAASLRLPFTDPASANYEAHLQPQSGKTTPVVIEDPTGADFIAIRTFDGVQPLAPSPLWMIRRLQKCGMRSISLAVDVTNYVMLELGQPLHAFDADQIVGSLRIKRAGEQATFTTLDGVERKLSPDNLMVCDDKRALALAGTMGGLNSEVTESTRRIALEAAHFNPVAVAKNSRTHRLSSEASRRLERAVDPALAKIASARAGQLLVELASATYVGLSTDGSLSPNRSLKFEPAKVSAHMGYEYSADQVHSALNAVGITVLDNAGGDVTGVWNVEVPSWRPDILGFADLVEEIARMNGFDLIPSNLPIGKGGARLSKWQRRRRGLGLSLAHKGFTEVMSSPFISEGMLTDLGFSGSQLESYRLANPMSEDFPLLRNDLLPGLLQTASRNLSRGAKDLAIFEIGSVFPGGQQPLEVPEISTAGRPSASEIDLIYRSVPKQPIHLAAVLIGQTQVSGWWGAGRESTWSDAIEAARSLIAETRNHPQISAVVKAPFHDGRCAALSVNGETIGYAGELHPRVIAALGLSARVCAFVIDLSALPFHDVTVAKPVFTMPIASQDLSLIVDSSVPAASVESALREGAGELLESITLFDRYDKLGDGKVSLAFTMTFRAPDRTLTAGEVSEFRERAGQVAVERFGAVLRA